ncbi:MAG: MBL fold metallo-hydrolase [Deltaproteobacteria bacterium]|nr:MBL fold metallo-hydrolase [Deltaproteobacteria bacterium]
MSSPQTDPKYNPPSFWPKHASVPPPKPVRGTRLTVLGCGTSAGVPLLACKCRVCASKNPRNNRTRASVTIQAGATTFLIDTSPDLRAQALRNEVHWIDSVLFTHPHADHIHGLDDLRNYNYLMARSIPCYGNQWTLDELTERFSYIFNENTQLGGGKPMLTLQLIEKRIKIKGVTVQPLELLHGQMPVLGYRINDVAYITDCSYIPDRTFRYLKGLEVLVLDCLRPAAHTTHLSVETALAFAKKIGAKKTFFTHMGHEIEYKKFARSLPRTMFPAYDGLVVST